MTTFASQIAARQLQQAREIARAVAPLAKRANRGVDDAHAHAVKAVTETLRAHDDGRNTIAHVRKSPSFDAANNRLDELEFDLVLGIWSFREASYRSSFAWNARTIPVSHLKSPDPQPTVADIDRCRAAIDNNQTLGASVRVVIDLAKRQLLCAITAAGDSRTERSIGMDGLANWARVKRNALGAFLQTAINDSWTLAAQQSGQDCLKAEFQVQPRP